MLCKYESRDYTNVDLIAWLVASYLAESPKRNDTKPGRDFSA